MCSAPWIGFLLCFSVWAQESGITFLSERFLYRNILVFLLSLKILIITDIRWSAMHHKTQIYMAWLCLAKNTFVRGSASPRKKHLRMWLSFALHKTLLFAVQLSLTTDKCSLALLSFSLWPLSLLNQSPRKKTLNEGPSSLLLWNGITKHQMTLISM